MLVFAIYGAAGTTGSAATTTVIDFTTMVACREARVALQHDEHLKTPGFHVFATCVEP
jgi:Flp pilus assembly CpaF family ATPase